MKITVRTLVWLLVLGLLIPVVPLRAQEESGAPAIEAAPTPEASAEPNEAKDLYKNLELFASVIEIIRKHYVKEMQPQELIYGALQGLLASLDPYSQFMEPDDYKEMKVETKGEFGGLGIEIGMRDGILTVITPIEDTPASRAGLQPGDKIVKIGEDTTKNITVTAAVKKLRGKPGTSVHLTILRAGEKELLEFTLIRDIIRIDSVKEVRMIEDGIGYIRLAQFQENTAEEFARGLEKIKKENPRGLVLDLRYNPGGLLSSAIAVADRFLPPGQIIVQTLGRNDQVEMEVKSTDGEKFPPIPMAVLINEGSASGSEIVAGALRDNRRAILVGIKSFGKGSVQSVLPLRDDSAIRLTTGHYYTASKRKIQDEGIPPDIEVQMTSAQKKAFIMKKYLALEKAEKEAKEKAKKEEGAGAPTPVSSPAPTPEIVGGEEPQSDAEEIEETEGLPGLEEKEEKGEAKEDALDPQLRKAVDALKSILLYRDFEEEGK
ncbi:MAG: S41 family peptidase [Candidatus Aureabacteria bacterium]|nr:S41 family peptidase [Candidatus Auribacterota bacterium]